MRKKFDDATEREIYDAYRTGEYLYKDLAAKYGCSISTVRHIVCRHDAAAGVVTPRHHGGGNTKRKFDAATEREIYDAYRSGESCTVIARRYDCDDRTVMHIVNRCDEVDGVKTPRHYNGRSGFSLLDRGRLSFRMSNKRAIELYMEHRRGVSQYRLSKRYGVSDTCVRAIIERVEKGARERGLKI